MTNLSPSESVWKRRFSRERLLVGAPLATGVVVLVCLLIFDGWPRLGRLQEQQERLEELRLKQASLPGLLRQLAKQENRAQQVAQEQALLVDLIAGRERIQTFLAEVGRVADETGIVVNSYEPSAPKAPKPSPTQSGSRRGSKRSKKTPPPKDPLTQLGYQKTSVLLKAKGPYESLQGFLRRMESIELLVMPSDLSLKALNNKGTANDDGVLVKPRTELNLRLSFFDRVAEPQTKDSPPPNGSQD